MHGSPPVTAAPRHACYDTRVERFTREERDALAPYFTNLDGPVFALVNLPEVVKGALFARYSRSPKSLRRLFLDEFREEAAAPVAHHIGTARADRLYERVFSEYGDDSVAQLGGVHLACEDASNILTKVLEWGRLMAYLEQSTRYIPYTDRPGGRWRYHVPAELDGHPLRERFVETHDRAFETYVRWIEPLRDHWASRLTRPADIGDAAWRSTIRAKALDSLRGLLPAATRSSVGIFGTGQGYEALLLRMRGHPLAEVRDYADRMLVELHKVIPAFLQRVDRPDRGHVWSDYLADSRRDTTRIADRLLAGLEPEPREEVTLTDFDPEGEIKVVAAALYASSRRPESWGRRSDGRSSTPTWARAPIGATSPGAPSSAPPIASTCSATTVPSATCSAIGSSPWSGSRCPRDTAGSARKRSRRWARSPTGATSWRRPAISTKPSGRPASARSPPTQCPWPTACATTWSSMRARPCT